MKIRSLFALVLVLSLIFLAGCNKTSSPEKAVEAYCKALVKADIKAMENLTAKDNKGSYSPYESIPEEVVGYFKENLKQTEYSVGSAKVEGDRASVTVNFKYKSAENILRASVQEFLKRRKKGTLKLDPKLELEAQLPQILTEIFLEKKAELSPKDTEISLSFDCVKEKKNWKILDYDKELDNILLSGFYGVEQEINSLFEIDLNSGD